MNAAHAPIFDFLVHIMLVRRSKTLIFLYFQKLRYLTSAFNRPGFQRMLADIKAGKIKRVVVKDDCVIKARTPQTLENRHFLRIGTEFRAIQRPQRAAYHIETS